jgi:transcriptional regulator of acetoin/glycerol metabolism
MRAPMPPDAPGDAEVMPPEGTIEPLKMVRDRAVRIVERAYLADVLARHEGNVSAAARAAGVDRIHFYRLLWRHGLK